MADHRDDDRRAGERLLCEPHNGSRTTEWLRFERDFSVQTDAIFLTEDGAEIPYHQLSRGQKAGGSAAIEGTFLGRGLQTLPVWYRLSVRYLGRIVSRPISGFRFFGTHSAQGEGDGPRLGPGA